MKLEPLTRKHLSDLYGLEDADDRLQNDLRVSMEGRGWAAVLDGRVLGAGGIVRIWQGTGVAWTVLSNEIKISHRKTLHKSVMHGFRQFVKELNLDRVQAEALYDEPTDCAWLMRLGFKFEGVMKKYRFGRDYVRFAWVRE